MHQKDINYVMDAHTNYPITPAKAFRKWDGKTPHYTQPLPNWLPPRVKQLVEMMTFQEGIWQEAEEVWSKPPEVRLYKLYDKVSNILDGLWMVQKESGYKEKYYAYTTRLREDAQTNYGELNITRITERLLFLEMVI